MRLWMIFGSVVVMSGCFLERAGTAVRDADAGRTDAGTTDAGGGDAGDAAGTDSGGIDSGGTDSGGIDAGGDDAGLMDAGHDAGFDAGPPACDALYGAAPGYVACAERATECEFRAVLASVRSCTSTCALLGGRCLSAFRNEDLVDLCLRSVAVGCDGMQIDNICVCSRGP